MSRRWYRHLKWWVGGPAYKPCVEGVVGIGKVYARD